MDAPTTHTFTVTVTCATADQATQVLSERLDHDEDYGFPYNLTWDNVHAKTSDWMRDTAYAKGRSDAAADVAAQTAHIESILGREGANSEGGWHSWRCFDKERYPEPCDCTHSVAVDIVDAAVTAARGGTDEAAT